MCGIVGYVGSRQVVPILVEGLQRLEYRGYDSAGVAVHDGMQTKVIRCRGKIQALETMLEQNPLSGTQGIGHTRWATHGRPTDENAHPHFVRGISVVHNGIIENHLALKKQLIEAGAKFSSETDTEIIAHLIANAMDSAVTNTSVDVDEVPDLPQAVRQALKAVRGAYAIVVMSDKIPDMLVAAKSASPLVIGMGKDEKFIASDIPAILKQTRSVLFVEEDELAIVTKDTVTLQKIDGTAVSRQPKQISWTPAQAEKGGYRHYMLKEIYEQPSAVTDTLAGRLDLEKQTVVFDDITLPASDRIVIVACGTSYHAAMVGKFLIESIAGIPTEVDLASEFHYRDPLVDPKDLVVAISQSGETADTLAAVRVAKQKGASTLAISNVLESSIARLADNAFYTHAGPEIGVASTKAFTTQLVAMVLLAMELGQQTGKVTQPQTGGLLQALTELPGKMREALQDSALIQKVAKRFSSAKGFLFLGRGMQYPIALEGALKLKEISYIHAEGYAAGEMKHGPIALIDDKLPVVALVPKDKYYEKTLANVSETRARDGRVLAVATQGDDQIANQVEATFWVPPTEEALLPILTTLPLQLIAYYVADCKGTDIDQPRNLAKSVTVE